VASLGITDKAAAQALLTGTPEQAASVLQHLRASADDQLLFSRVQDPDNAALTRGRVGIALLQRHMQSAQTDSGALGLLLKAAQHLGDRESIEWASRRLLRLDPQHVQAHCEMAKAAHYRGSPAERDEHFAALVGLLRQVVAARKVDMALYLEATIYNNLVKLVEDEDYARDRLRQMIPAMDELGRYVRTLLPEVPAPQAIPGAPRVGFVFPTGVLLAHTKVLLSICEAMQEAGLGLITPLVYVLGEARPDFVQAFQACNVPVKVIDPAGGPSNSAVVNRLAGLRAALAADGVRLSTWVSVPPGTAFFTAARHAQRHAYWSMKFHGMIAPGIDHYVSCASCWETEKTVHGQAWQCGPVTFKDALAGGDPEQTAAFRARLPADAVILGVLAREEKIFSPPYLSVVAEILEACPKAVFIWSGRTEHAGIRAFFAERGLNARTPWIGWVNTATVTPAIDVFLETFPFGCGMTAAQALASGIPVVDFKDWSSVFGHHLEPLFSGRAGTDIDRAKVHALFVGPDGTDYFTMASDNAAYVATARRLIEDVAYRREFGAAGRRFYEAYLGNSVFSAERFSRILRDLALQELRECA
jgi:hypothetical protein